MIRFFGLGHSRVLLGGPLRILVLTEDSSLETPRIQDLPIPSVRFFGDKTIEMSLQYLSSINDYPGVTVRTFVTEIDTSVFVPASYEVQLEISGEVIGLEENLWVLDVDQYEGMLKEEMLGVEEGSASLSRIGNESALSRDTLSRIVRNVFSQKLYNFVSVAGTLLVAPEVEVSFDSPSEFAGDPLSYVAEVFADQCRDVLLFGADTLNLTVVFSDRLYRFVLNSRLSDSVSAFFRANIESSSSDFHLAIKGLREMLNTSEMQDDVNFGDNQRVVRISLEVRGTRYRVAGA